jgi:hypothetical protein
MYLVQLLLPLYDNDGMPFSRNVYLQVRDELVQRFGGMTAYTQAPASGLWQENGERTVHDDLVVYEVMSESLDAGWWSHYRTMLEARFRQERLVVRAQPMQLL